MRGVRMFLPAATLLIAVGLGAGCAPVGSQLCVRDPLDRKQIRFDDERNSLIIDDHIYFSKEGSGSNRGFGSAGCGCN